MLTKVHNIRQTLRKGVFSSGFYLPSVHARSMRRKVNEGVFYYHPEYNVRPTVLITW